MHKNRLLVALFGAALFFSPLAWSESIFFTNSAEMWWCPGCGLAYPASQKTCLNKACPLFKKPK